jgi:hypothetical protein
LLVGSGIANTSQITAITSFVILGIPMLLGYISHIKTANISSGKLTAQSNGTVTKSGPPPGPRSGANIGQKTVVLLFLIGATMSLHAQSLLQPLPRYRATPSFARIIGPADSLPSISTGKWQGFRLAGPDVMMALPDLSLWTGAGIDYVWAVANTSSGQWQYQYTIGLRAEGGANLPSPGTVKAIGGFGLRITLFNGLLALGGIYNLTLKHAQAAIGNPVALIPGLN